MFDSLIRLQLSLQLPVRIASNSSTFIERGVVGFTLQRPPPHSLKVPELQFMHTSAVNPHPVISSYQGIDDWFYSQFQFGT